MFAAARPQPTHSAGASVRLVSVSRHWGSVAALDRVSIVVEPGSFAVLLGPSGLWQDNLLAYRRRIGNSNAGRVEIAGRDVTNVPPGRTRRRRWCSSPMRCFHI